jgi:H/ACA ribonucleoprotein complex subunit 2
VVWWVVWYGGVYTAVMGEKDKSKSESGEGEDKETKWEDLIGNVNAIANPLASRRLTKKLYKVIKKANKHKKHVRKGVREVQKCVRKGERGIVVIAGDISPIEVVCHMPAVCEEKELPYCYTPSKQDLGAACGSKRPTCMVLIRENEDYKELYDDCESDVQGLPLPI